MTTQQIPMLLFAGGLAGFVNAVAGGGSFITFPALLALGLTPTVANATNNTAMWIGNCGSVSGYWMCVKNNAVTLIPAIAVSLAGGLVGANLLLLTPETTFVRLVPWLLAGATLLFAAGGAIKQGPARSETACLGRWVLPPLFLVGVYGGYFGAASSILTLALLSFSGVSNIHRANGMKGIISFFTTGIATLPFCLAGKIAWPFGLVLALAVLLGAYAGARTARRLPAEAVRTTIVAIGVVLSAYFFARPIS